jgi:hypothetical protein
MREEGEKNERRWDNEAKRTGERGEKGPKKGRRIDMKREKK